MLRSCSRIRDVAWLISRGPPAVEPERVGDHQQGGDEHRAGGEDRREAAGGGEDDAEKVVGKGPEEVP